MREIVGDLCHDGLVKTMKHALAYDEKRDYVQWKNEVREKLTELLRIKQIEQNACPLNMEIEEDIMLDGYRRIRFVFESEKGSFVPCYLCIPDTGKEKYPVAITVQGHSSGFHNSVGIKKYERDESYHPRGQFALQAVRNGYAALALELRAIGERKTWRTSADVLMCAYQTLTAFELGRTTIGERCWDVSRAIDLLSNFKELDTDKILITGNSGGGTLSYYAACMDERIKCAAPSCAFCTFEDSILMVYHCACNFIPDIYKWFEMQDVACLIAPRPLTIMNGELDSVFLYSGTQKGYETVKKVYEKEGAADNCRLVGKNMDHYWEGNIEWEAINEMTTKMGWWK